MGYIKLTTPILFIMAGFFLSATPAQTSTTLPKTINSDLTLTAEGGPYSIPNFGGDSVTIYPEATLTIEPGAILQFSLNARLRVQGTLIVNGTAENPVIFTSSRTNPTPGSWGYLQFSSGGSAIINGAIVEYAGRSSSQNQAAFQVGNSNVQINGVLFRNNHYAVIEQTGGKINADSLTIVNNGFPTESHTSGQPTIFIIQNGEFNLSNSEIEANRILLNCGRLGSVFAHYRPEINFTQNIIHSEGLVGVPKMFFYNNCHLQNNENQWPSEGHEFIHLYGPVTQEMTLPEIDYPFRINSHATYTILGTLNIPAGAIFKAGLRGRFLVEGNLNANGTPQNPILFTSIKDDEAYGRSHALTQNLEPQDGDWDGLRFINPISGTNRTSTLDHVHFKYGGVGFAGTVYRDGQMLVAQNTTVQADGLKFFQTENHRCIMVRNGGQLIIEDSEFNDCQVTAIENINTEQWVDALNNWWGSATGPYHQVLNPEGKGREVKGLINFEPWLTEEPEILIEPEEESVEVIPIPPSFSGPTPIPVTLSVQLEADRIHQGQSTILRWQSTGVSNVEIAGLGNHGPQGEISVSPRQTTVFNVIASNSFGAQTQNVQLTVEPYDRDPVLIVPGILGSWPKYKGFFGELTLDPILRTYDDLINTLVLNGYEHGVTLFTFPYQWRQSNTISALQLEMKLDQIKRNCQCTKIDIVAHSMGGLVSRQYIQSNRYKGEVDQLIFLGTPHLGAPKAYLMWEGGEFEIRGPQDRFLQILFMDEAKRNNYKHTSQYIREQVKSVGQLLPTYNYLIHNFSGQPFNYLPCREVMYPCNRFLEQLTSTNHLLNQRVRVVNFYSDTSTTLRHMVVEQKTDGINWFHGRPITYLYDKGDGTVPLLSARAIPGSHRHAGNVGHSELAIELRGEITKALLGKQTVPVSQKLGMVQRILFIGKYSPVYLEVVDPLGRTFGFNQENEIEGYYYTGPESEDEYIIIADPVEGDWQIKTHGYNEGEFTVVMSMIDDEEVQELSFSGQATVGSQAEFVTILSEEKLEVLNLEETEEENEQSINNDDTIILSTESAEPTENSNLDLPLLNQELLAQEDGQSLVLGEAEKENYLPTDNQKSNNLFYLIVFLISSLLIGFLLIKKHP